MQDNLVQIQEEKVKLLLEVEQLSATLELKTKEQEEMQANFEKLKASATNGEVEFAAFKTAQDVTIQQMTKEKEDLLIIKNDLQVRLRVNVCFVEAPLAINHHDRVSVIQFLSDDFLFLFSGKV